MKSPIQTCSICLRSPAVRFCDPYDMSTYGHLPLMNNHLHSTRHILLAPAFPVRTSSSSPACSGCCYARYLLIHDSVHGRFPGTVEASLY